MIIIIIIVIIIESERAKRVYNLVAREVRAVREPRVVLASCKIECPIFLSMNISLGVR